MRPKLRTRRTSGSRHDVMAMTCDVPAEDEHAGENFISFVYAREIFLCVAQWHRALVYRANGPGSISTPVQNFFDMNFFHAIFFSLLPNA